MNAIKIIVVDDTEQFRRAVAKWFRRLGCEVVEFADGDEALQAVRGGESFDVLLTDWLMPSMKGDELVRRLKADGYEQPMALWTASFPLPTCDEADATVHKSVGLPGITDVLRQLLGLTP